MLLVWLAGPAWCCCPERELSLRLTYSTCTGNSREEPCSRIRQCTALAVPQEMRGFSRDVSGGLQTGRGFANGEAEDWMMAISLTSWHITALLLSPIGLVLAIACCL